MTPQDIREKIFEKAVFGGYDMGSVDDFMEEMAAELESAQRESATLKAKMKVLVDKIEEYRASEDAMRMTLLSAQKLSAQIESEARARADKLIADAQATASRSLDTLKADTKREEAKLKEARESLARFLDDARALCKRQLDYLEGNAAAMPAAPASEEPAPEIDISPVMNERAPRQTITPDDMTRLFNMGGN